MTRIRIVSVLLVLPAVAGAQERKAPPPAASRNEPAAAAETPEPAADAAAPASSTPAEVSVPGTASGNKETEAVASQTPEQAGPNGPGAGQGLGSATPVNAEPAVAGASTAREEGASPSENTDASESWAAQSSAEVADSHVPPRLKLGLGGDAPRIHAGIGGALLRHADSGFAVFTEERWTEGLTASAGVDILRFLDRWRLSVDADWSREVHRSAGLFGQSGRSKFNAHILGLGASLRYEALGWCQPYIHAWGGFAATRATIAVHRIRYASDPARQYLPALGAAVGATVWGPTLSLLNEHESQSVVALGVRVEAGYLVTGAFDFDYGLHGTGAYPIAVYEPEAGTLRLDAPYIRIVGMLGAL